MEKISSNNNKKIKDLSKLKKKKYIIDKSLFLVEGNNLITEAFKNNIVKEILVSDDELYLDFIDEKIERTLVTKEIIEKLSNNETNEGAIAVCYLKNNNKQKVEDFKKIIVLDQINNPGNLGTIIRTAKAFGFEAVMLINNSVFPYNDKVIKSTQGAIFDYPIFEVELNQLKGIYYPYFFILDKNAHNIDNINIELNKKPIALVFGNEANGISNSTIENWKGEKVYIEIDNSVESLNVAIAAGISMYKFK